jgi:magnesium-protoporphyrin O-methyltransferase
MNCCQCQGIEAEFDPKQAARKLEAYRAHGPDLTTRILIDALRAEGVEGMTLLDIGGGIGAIQHELLRYGVKSVTDVEASTASIAAARAEHERQGHADRVDYRHGNFCDLAADLPPADIVTLDRVICCYHDMQALVDLSAARARKLYGVVYPRDTWWLKIGFAVENFFYRLRQSSFRTFLHPTAAVESLVRSLGLERRFYRQTLVWQIAIYAR